MKSFNVLLLCLMLTSSTCFAGTFFWGSDVAVGNGMAKSFVQFDQKQKPVAIGIALTGSALQGLPSVEHEYEYLLPLPEFINLPPYKHVTLNWNPHGHEPLVIYGAPHFDFHFYTLTSDERANITCAGTDEPLCMQMPEAGYAPDFYAPTPAGVPMMGWHWFDTRSPEFNGQPFTATFIYGFYKGVVAFVEPMITRDFLLNKNILDQVVPVSTKVKETGYYPQSYSVSYDSVNDLVLVRMKDLSKIMSN